MPPPRRKRRTLPSLDRVIAAQVKALRRKQNVSQQWLADKLGETQSTITRIESGERAITVSEVFRIAAALNCAPVELMSGGLTGEKDVPVTPRVRVEAMQAAAWIVGTAPLGPVNDATWRAYYMENISEWRAAQVRKAAEENVRFQAAMFPPDSEQTASGEVEDAR